MGKEEKETIESLFDYMFSVVYNEDESKKFPEQDNCPVCGDPIPDGMDFCSEDCELRSHDISDLEDRGEET